MCTVSRSLFVCVCAQTRRDGSLTLSLAILGLSLALWDHKIRFVGQ
jgi:hypothetical protein